MSKDIKTPKTSRSLDVFMMLMSKDIKTPKTSRSLDQVMMSLDINVFGHQVTLGVMMSLDIKSKTSCDMTWCPKTPFFRHRSMSLNLCHLMSLNLCHLIYICDIDVTSCDMTWCPKTPFFRHQVMSHIWIKPSHVNQVTRLNVKIHRSLLQNIVSFTGLFWKRDICDMTWLTDIFLSSYVWPIRDSLVCVTWVIRMCDMTRSYVWHDSFICVTWLIHNSYISLVICMTHSYVCQGMTHSYVWHDSLVCVTWDWVCCSVLRCVAVCAAVTRKKGFCDAFLVEPFSMNDTTLSYE